MYNVIYFYHLGVYLKDVILNVLNKFKIEPYQLYTITSDNGANMLKATNLIEEHILSEVSISDNESETERMDIAESEAGSIIETEDDNRYNLLKMIFKLNNIKMK